MYSTSTAVNESDKINKQLELCVDQKKNLFFHLLKYIIIIYI